MASRCGSRRQQPSKKRKRSSTCWRARYRPNILCEMRTAQKSSLVQLRTPGSRQNLKPEFGSEGGNESNRRHKNVCLPLQKMRLLWFRIHSGTDGRSRNRSERLFVQPLANQHLFELPIILLTRKLFRASERRA